MHGGGDVGLRDAVAESDRRAVGDPDVESLRPGVEADDEDVTGRPPRVHGGAQGGEQKARIEHLEVGQLNGRLAALAQLAQRPLGAGHTRARRLLAATGEIGERRRQAVDADVDVALGPGSGHLLHDDAAGAHRDAMGAGGLDRDVVGDELVDGQPLRGQERHDEPGCRLRIQRGDAADRSGQPRAGARQQVLVDRGRGLFGLFFDGRGRRPQPVGRGGEVRCHRAGARARSLRRHRHGRRRRRRRSRRQASSQLGQIALQRRDPDLEIRRGRGDRRSATQNEQQLLDLPLGRGPAAFEVGHAIVLRSRLGELGAERVELLDQLLVDLAAAVQLVLEQRDPGQRGVALVGQGLDGHDARSVAAGAVDLVGELLGAPVGCVQPTAQVGDLGVLAPARGALAGREGNDAASLFVRGRRVVRRERRLHEAASVRRRSDGTRDPNDRG